MDLKVGDEVAVLFAQYATTDLRRMLRVEIGRVVNVSEKGTRITVQTKRASYSATSKGNVVGQRYSYLSEVTQPIRDEVSRRELIADLRSSSRRIADKDWEGVTLEVAEEAGRFIAQAEELLRKATAPSFS